MEESLLSRLDRRIESRSLLTHPFYQAWQAGILSQDDLRAYARQYYFFEANFPRFFEFHPLALPAEGGAPNDSG